MTGNEKTPQGQVEKMRVGGREVLIGLSRRDYMSLRLAHRRLRDYIDEDAFVHPEDLEWIAVTINEITGGPTPWPDHVR